MSETKITKELKKATIIFAVVVIIVGVGSFYGGMSYASNNVRNAFAARGGNLAMGQNGAQGGRQGTRGAFGGGGGFNGGDVISKDDKSVTIKLQSGGSKIIFYSETTGVGKFINGTMNDIKIGETVSINGNANADGSVTATSIQVRPPRPSPLPQ